MPLPLITSPSNPRVKHAAALRESRRRRKSGEFLIDGVREIDRARKSGVRLLEVYIEAEQGEKGLPTAPGAKKDLLDELERTHFPVWPVIRSVFAKLAFGQRNEGIVALAEEPARGFDLFESQLPENPLLCVLERIEKPGNIGAVFRSADGAGLDGIILADCGDDLWHPNIIRSSLGTVFRVPCVAASAGETIAWLRARHFRIASAICDAALPYSEIDYTGATAIVLGSEDEGLTPIWHDKGKTGPDSAAIVLPMRGIADSLNISNAAAVLFYHALLQREANRP
ncbi:MAG: RNA methyltransferase [Thermoguttaceae bacterium]|jgi:TrmH family RNA methyltransferase|nr:RNA methyltransferase [Thermoguttaceae bacterium]